MATDLFLSHDWGADGKTNHDKVTKFNKALKGVGYVTWFDSERMNGHIRDKMADGIDNTKCFVAFITKRYHDKVVSGEIDDNCKLEFDYASRRVKMIAIVIDASMRNTKEWKGNIGMSLSSHMYVDISGDLNDEKYVSRQVVTLMKELSAIGVEPLKTVINNSNEQNEQNEQADLSTKTLVTTFAQHKQDGLLQRNPSRIKDKNDDYQPNNSQKSPPVATSSKESTSKPPPSSPTSDNFLAPLVIVVVAILIMLCITSGRSGRTSRNPNGLVVGFTGIDQPMKPLRTSSCSKMGPYHMRGLTIRNRLESEVTDVKIAFCSTNKELRLDSYVVSWVFGITSNCPSKSKVEVKLVGKGQQTTTTECIIQHDKRAYLQVRFRFQNHKCSIETKEKKKNDQQATSLVIENDSIPEITIRRESDGRIKLDFTVNSRKAYLYGECKKDISPRTYAH